jgi:Alpha mannosidase middle domain
LTTFTDDFYPMEEIYKDSFWTGYFTTRGNGKRQMREFSTIATMSNTLYALEMFRLYNLTSNLTALREATYNNTGLQSLMTHHDTITGTSYEYVSDDYIDQISNQTRNNSIPLTDIIERQLLEQGISLYNFDPCYHQFNRRFQCPGLNFSFVNYDHFLVAIYNPSLQDQYLINI